MSILPKTFRFSALTTLVCLALAAIMLRASFWQWDRYKAKVALLETYRENSRHPATPLTQEILSQLDEARVRSHANGDLVEYEHALAPYLNHKVSLRGTFDFSHQIIITNRKNADGPGHLLLAPFRSSDGGFTIWVSRGFIPFEDRNPKDWEKYNTDSEETILGVVKESISPYSLGPRNPEPKSFDTTSRDAGEFPRIWFFEELPKLNNILPYPCSANIFLQKIGAPLSGKFPEEAISIQVPPSTHFGYTIEWAILAFITLVLGFLRQAIPSRYRRKSDVSKEFVANTANLMKGNT